MSRKWNIKCTTCYPSTNPTLADEDVAVLWLGEGSNHNEEGAIAIAKASTTIAALGKVLPEARVQFDFALSVPAAWFARHDKHKLIVVDEYGELSDNYWPEPVVEWTVAEREAQFLDAVLHPQFVAMTAERGLGVHEGDVKLRSWTALDVKGSFERWRVLRQTRIAKAEETNAAE